MDFNSFSHGQVQSKLWLCDILEPLIPKNANVAIVGSWHGVLTFMMLSRKEEHYNMITGIDKDPESIVVADKVLAGWSIGEGHKAKNILANVEDMSDEVFSHFDVVINTSCEHMNSDWYKKVTSKQLICLQTSNRVTDDPVWNITNPYPTLEVFKTKHPISRIIYEGEKIFDYGHLCYSRYMLIGRL